MYDLWDCVKNNAAVGPFGVRGGGGGLMPRGCTLLFAIVIIIAAEDYVQKMMRDSAMPVEIIQRDGGFRVSLEHSIVYLKRISFDVILNTL